MTSSPGGPQGEENNQEPLEETPQGSSFSSSRANPTEGPPGTTSCPLPPNDHNRSTASVPQTEWVGVSSSLVNSWTINVSFGIPEKFQPHFLFQSNSSRSHVTELKHSFCGARRGCWWAGGAKELQRPPTLRSFAQETLVCGSRGLVQFQSFRVLGVVSPPLGLLWSQGLFVGAPVKNSPPGGGFHLRNCCLLNHLVQSHLVALFELLEPSTRIPSPADGLPHWSLSPGALCRVAVTMKRL